MKSITNFLFRHLVWIILIIAGIVFLWSYFDAFFLQYLATLLMVIIAEGVALGLSGLALYAFTNIEFTRLIAFGKDKKLSATEQHGLLLATGYIFLGVHFVVGIVIAGLYFATFV